MSLPPDVTEDELILEAIAATFVSRLFIAYIPLQFTRLNVR